MNLNGIDFYALRNYYGLPQEKPEDWHKCFFSYSDAWEFINQARMKHFYEIIECRPYYGRVKIPIKNIFANSIWAVMKKW